jgi:hypothetical protein
MGKLFEKPTNPSGSGADDEGSSRKPSPIMQGLSVGLQQGINTLDQQKQAIAANAKPVNITVQGAPASVMQPSLDYLAAAKARFEPNSGFYGGK